MTKYLIGKKAVIDALKENKLSKVFLQKPVSEVLLLCKKNNVSIEYPSSSNLFNKNTNHQGCIGILKNELNIYTDFNLFFETINLDQSKKSIILILDSLQDPGNFGSIIRSAKAFGVKHIIFKKDNQVQINDHVIKTSCGTIDSINFLKVANLSNIIDKLKKENYWVFSSSLNYDSVFIEENFFDIKKIVLIVGNENKGISPNIINKSDYKIKIKITEDLDSLNVSVACGILLHYFSLHKI